jgi:ubiquinone/menaquinone biosynthesis C-methylase UbiE
MQASDLAQSHWNDTPLFYSEDERYRIYPWLPEVAEFSQHQGHKVLEVGCGTGSDLLQFAKHGAEAHGIDITDEHLRLAKQRVGEQATVQYGDGRAIPYPDASFDYVYSHGVIHHSDEPQKITAEIMRVLKPGGRFNIQVYAKWSYFPLYLMLRFGRKWRLYIENSREPVHIDLYTARSLRKLFPVPVTISKFQGPLHRWLGWYLVATGQRAR